MKKLILGMTVIMTSLSYGIEQNIAELNILCQSDLDAVCMSIKGKDSYAQSHTCATDTIEKDGNLSDYVSVGVDELFNLLDPSCYGQQSCTYYHLEEGYSSKVYKQYWLDDSEKGYSSSEVIRGSLKFRDVKNNVLKTIECE